MMKMYLISKGLSKAVNCGSIVLAIMENKAQEAIVLNLSEHIQKQRLLNEISRLLDFSIDIMAWLVPQRSIHESASVCVNFP